MPDYKCQSLTLLHDRNHWKRCNHEILKLLSLLNSYWDLKLYNLHVNFDEVGITPKQPEQLMVMLKVLVKVVFSLFFMFYPFKMVFSLYCISYPFTLRI